MSNADVVNELEFYSSPVLIKLYVARVSVESKLYFQFYIFLNIDHFQYICMVFHEYLVHKTQANAQFLF